MASGMEESFIVFLRDVLSEIENQIVIAYGPGRQMHARISAMRMAGGVDYRDAEAQTVAVQWEFEDMDKALRWESGEFSHVAQLCEEAFGQQVMIFTSVFEVIE